MGTVVVIRKEGTMFYVGCLLFGLALVCLSVAFFWMKRDYVYDFRERYNIYVGTRDLSVNTPGGLTIGLAISRSDREVAWRIYTQLATRIAVVDFNDDYDSFYLVNVSLHSLFGLIREELASIPVERVRRDRSDEMVKFYMSILNEGIRPYLSKWHMPISQWVDKQKKTNPDATYYELEKTFPERKEVLADVRSMNLRMKGIGEQLLKIAKAN